MILGVPLGLALVALLTSCGQPTVRTATASSTHPPYNFKRYLSFTPLLPTVRDGYPFTQSFIWRTFGDDHRTSIIQYWAVFGNPDGNSIQLEAAPSWVFGAVPNLIRDSVSVTRHGIEYYVWSQGSVASHAEIERVAESLGRPAVKAPNEIGLQWLGSSSSRMVGFPVLNPGVITFPSHAYLRQQSSFMNIYPFQHRSVEAYRMVYSNGIAIYESKTYGLARAHNLVPSNDKEEVRRIGGLKVTFQFSTTGAPHVPRAIHSATFVTRPGTAFDVDNNRFLPRAVFQRIVGSIVVAARTLARQGGTS